MNEDLQRIAIAEACGWKWVSHVDIYGTPGWGWEKPGSYHTEDSYKSQKEERAIDLPDYLNDLNAIHEAEKWLRGTPEQYHNDPEVHRRWREYEYYLTKNYGCHATAAQRAELFLAILNHYK